MGGGHGGSQGEPARYRPQTETEKTGLNESQSGTTGLDRAGTRPKRPSVGGGGASRSKFKIVRIVSPLKETKK